MSHFTANTSCSYSSSVVFSSLVVKVRGWGGEEVRLLLISEDSQVIPAHGCPISLWQDANKSTAAVSLRSVLLQPHISVRDESCWSQLAQLAVELVDDGIRSYKLCHAGVDSAPRARWTQPR